MADIAMCTNDACPSHRTCYRFMAKPCRHRQSYMDFIPEEGDDKCKSFWPLSEGLTPVREEEK